VIREQESGVYTVNARGSMNKVPYSSYNFNISFPCGPENTEKLITASLGELNKIIANGPTQVDLDKFKQAEILEYRKQMKENRYWMSNFTKCYNNSSKPEDILELEAKINAVTVAQIQEVAKKYLAKDKTIGVLMPE
jgi:zinc protease